MPLKTAAVRGGLALLLTVAVLPAYALFDDEEARSRIEQLKTDVLPRLERIENALAAQTSIAFDLENLRAEMSKLRGQVEVLAYELETAQKRQKDFYVDLDDRLRRLEPGAQGGGSPRSSLADPASETREYEAALSMLREAKYKESAAAFADFRKKYPNSVLSPAAEYWMASAQLQNGDIKTAMEGYARVAANWPDHQKAADALLGVANCQDGLKDTKASRATLETIVSKYATTPAADIARQRLGKKK